MTYVIGSDKKTVSIALELCAKINAAMDSGNHVEAGRLIDAALSSPNIPFRREFLFRAGTNCHDNDLCAS